MPRIPQAATEKSERSATPLIHMACGLVLTLTCAFVFGEPTTQPAAATTNRKSNPKRPIEFFRPQHGPRASEASTEVIVSGTLAPGAKVQVANQPVRAVTAKGTVRLNPKSVFLSQKMLGSDALTFEMLVRVPYGRISLPLELLYKNQKRFFVLNFSVDRKTVEPELPLPPSPFVSKRMGLWLGLGFNYLSYEQDSPEIPSAVNFETIKYPSYFARVWYRVSDTVYVNLTWNRSPGSASSSESVSVLTGDYYWDYFALEANYLPNSWRHLWWGRNAQSGVISGLQYHLVPFLTRGSDSATNATIETNELLMLALGYKLGLRFTQRSVFEFFMRYQYPMSSGSLFDISPTLAFDGSVGSYYELTERQRLGLFWYGQYHQYDFEHVDPFTEATVSGSQTLLFSNLELRYGFDF